MSAAEGRDLLVDLGQCTFADSAIVSLLLGTERTLAGRGRRCDLIIPPDSGYVTRLFEITGIAELFRVHVSLEAALASLAEPRELRDRPPEELRRGGPRRPAASIPAWPEAPASDGSSPRPSSKTCASERTAI